MLYANDRNNMSLRLQEFTNEAPGIGYTMKIHSKLPVMLFGRYEGRLEDTLNLNASLKL